MDRNTRISILQSLSKTKELPVSTGAELLDVNRTTVYYTPVGVSDEELECKAIIDRLHTDHPTWGARQMSKQLYAAGHKVGRKKARRYMTDMGIDPIYPKMNLSKRAHNAHILPYLLRNAIITRPNQAWSVDITYISMKHGFMYLTAIIDWYSRCIVGWELDDTLGTDAVLRAMDRALAVATPEIVNSDQGCQFTSDEYMQYLKDRGIRQSMDGKSRWADNIMIERWFRSLKYEEIYLHQYETPKELRAAIRDYVNTYNFDRFHSALDYQTPASVYFPAMLYEAAREAA